MFAEMPLDNRTVNKFAARRYLWALLLVLSWLSAAFNLATDEAI